MKLSPSILLILILFLPLVMAVHQHTSDWGILTWNQKQVSDSFIGLRSSGATATPISGGSVTIGKDYFLIHGRFSGTHTITGSISGTLWTDPVNGLGTGLASIKAGTNAKIATYGAAIVGSGAPAGSAYNYDSVSFTAVATESISISTSDGSGFPAGAVFGNRYGIGLQDMTLNNYGAFTNIAGIVSYINGTAGCNVSCPAAMLMEVNASTTLPTHQCSVAQSGGQACSDKVVFSGYNSLPAMQKFMAIQMKGNGNNNVCGSSFSSTTNALVAGRSYIIDISAPAMTVSGSVTGTYFTATSGGVLSSIASGSNATAIAWIGGSETVVRFIALANEGITHNCASTPSTFQSVFKGNSTNLIGIVGSVNLTSSSGGWASAYLMDTTATAAFPSQPLSNVTLSGTIAYTNVALVWTPSTGDGLIGYDITRKTPSNVVTTQRLGTSLYFNETVNEEGVFQYNVTPYSASGSGPVSNNVSLNATFQPLFGDTGTLWGPNGRQALADSVGFNYVGLGVFYGIILTLATAYAGYMAGRTGDHEWAGAAIGSIIGVAISTVIGLYPAWVVALTGVGTIAIVILYRRKGGE